MLKSFKYAIWGISVCLKERNFKIHLIAATLVIIAGTYFKVTSFEWLIIILNIGLVLSLEMINTAIERWVDYVSPEKNKIAGQIKDISAGATLVGAIIAAVCGSIIFYKYIIDLINT